MGSPRAPLLRKPLLALWFAWSFHAASFERKMGSTVLNRRLLVSYRTSGLLNRPLAALAFGTLKPLFEENRFFAQKKRCCANLFLFLRAFFALSFFTKV